MSAQELIAFLFFVFVCFAVAGISGLFMAEGVGAWYDHLRKPRFNPPKWIFGPVWTLLYLMMGVAGFLAWREVGFWHVAMLLFFVQLALNFAWSFVFFSAHRIGLALADILVLWLSILVTLVAFAQISMPAALLLAPYLAWVSFAGVLNASIWRLNHHHA